MSPRSRRADRWIWSDDDLDRSESRLRKLCDGSPIKMSDLELVAQFITGQRHTARAMRDALIESGRLVRRTTVGRGSDYLLVDRPRPDPDDHGPIAACWFVLAILSFAA